MRTSKTLFVALVAGLIGPGCSLAVQSSRDHAPVEATEGAHGRTPLRVARTLPLGSTVSIEGTVSTPSGVFNSSFYDRGFAVQDRLAGIFVSLQYDLGMKVGQKVRVTGAIGDSNGLALLVPGHPNDVQVLPGVGELEPLVCATGSVNETTEGRLVTVTGQITQSVVSDLPYGYKFLVDDGSGALMIFINIETGIDPSVYTQGTRVRITGFSSQYADHYEIDPRFPRDLHILSGHD